MTNQQIQRHNKDVLCLAHSYLHLVSYFEGENVKIQLFRSGNDHFKEKAKLDAEQVRSARGKNEKVSRPWRSQDMIFQDGIAEVEKEELQLLFRDKFRIAQRDFGVKTEKRFAIIENKDFKLRYKCHWDWFPVLSQWSNYLENISTNGISQNKRSRSDREIALIRFYSEKPITKDDSINSFRNVGKEFGIEVSGKLYQTYTRVTKKNERLIPSTQGVDGKLNDRVNKRRLEEFENVINYLKDHDLNTENAIQEMSAFKLNSKL